MTGVSAGGGAPFARVNQDCVDIIVEYAAADPDSLLQLRLVSEAFAEGVGNLFALVCPARDGADECFDDTTADGIWRHMGVVGARRGWGGSLLLLAAVGSGRNSRQRTRMHVTGGFLHPYLRRGTGGDGVLRCLVARFPALTDITLSNCYDDFTDVGLISIVDHCGGAMRSLKLAECSGIGSVGLAYVAMHCPALESLCLQSHSLSWINASLLRLFGGRCTRLKRLAFVFSIAVDTDKDLVHEAASGFAELEALSVVHVRSDAPRDMDTVSAFVQACPKLTSVDLSRSAVSDVACMALAYNRPQLRALSLSQCIVSTAALDAIVKHCRELVDLDVSNLDELNGRRLVDWTRQLPRLEHLRMSNMPFRLTVGQLCTIARRCPRLRSVTAMNSFERLSDADVARLERCRPGCTFVLQDDNARVSIHGDVLVDPRLRPPAFGTGDRGTCDAPCQALDTHHGVPEEGRSGATMTPQPASARACFARVNQGCVDVIVGYAAADPDSLLQLRGISRGFGTGVRNLAALVCRGMPDADAAATLDAGQADAMLSWMGEAGAAWRGARLPLAAVCCGSWVSKVVLNKTAVQHCGGLMGTDHVARFLARCLPLLRDVSFVGGGRLPDDCQLTDRGLADLADLCPELRSLEVKSCRGITPAGIVCVASSCPGLEHLSLKTDLYANAALLGLIGRRCPRMKSLEIQQYIASRGRGDNLLDAARTFTALTHVTAANKVHTSVVVAFAEHCPTLTSVDVSGSDDAGDATCMAVAHHCPQLRALNVSRTRVTLVGLDAIARRCRGLAHLELSGLSLSSSTLLVGCLRIFPILERLVMDNMSCGGSPLRAAAVLAVAKECRLLQSVSAVNTEVSAADLSTLETRLPRCVFRFVENDDDVESRRLSARTVHTSEGDASDQCENDADAAEVFSDYDDDDSDDY